MKKVALFLLLATLCTCSESGPPEPPWGAAIVVQISGARDAPQTALAAARIVEQNLARLGFIHARAKVLEGNRMSIRVPGADPSNIRRVGWALFSSGTMRIHESADAKTQEAYNKVPLLPAGYRVVENRDAQSRLGPPWDVDRILIKAEALVRERMVSDAWAKGSDAIFRLEREARKGFDAAARRGPLTVLLDNQLCRMDMVSGSSPDGDGLIACANGDEATSLALILMTGNMPVQLGLGRFGTCSPRVVESHEFYGTPPAKAP